MMRSVFIAMALLIGLSVRAVAQSQVGVSVTDQSVSLNGAWRFEPAGGTERGVTVPGFWERLPGFANTHEAVYRREFDIPASFAGRCVFLKFDAVGDAADVSVNGQHAGGHVGACLPFTVDIADLVVVPSTTNKLEVLVRDDSHFSVVRGNEKGRNRKHWIPRGMGANNRKGLSWMYATNWACW